MKQNIIPFYRTMTARKRGEGAYLRKNILNNEEEGLTPSVDFQNKQFNTSTNADSAYLLINDYVFVEEGGVTKVYQNSGSGDLVFRANMPDNSDPVAVSETSVNNKVLVLLEDGKLYSVQNTSVVLIHDFSVGAFQAYIVYNGFFHFISIDTKIYRIGPDLASPNVTIVKNTTAENQSEILNMQIFNDYIVMVRSLGRLVQFDFWSITTASLDTYQKRVVERNCRHLGLGNVDGTLMFVKSVGNGSNRKEKLGDIVVTAFDGEKFVKLNSIRAGDDEVLTNGSAVQSIGNGIMIVAVSNNTDTINETLFKNWVLKIKNDGQIETLFEPSDVANGDEVKALGVEDSYISMLFKQTDGRIYFYHTEDYASGYDDFRSFNTSEYITNFLNDNRNVHRLVSFGVSYDKVFEQLSQTKGERLFVDYRTSERDDWTLLHEINSEKIKDYTADEFRDDLRQTEYTSDSTGQTIQSYVIKKMPDGSELPRFNEIQFRFRLKKGFTVLNAWYNYENIIRNTL